MKYEMKLHVPKLNDEIVEVWEWISNFNPTFNWARDYLSIPELQWIHINESCPWNKKWLIVTKIFRLVRNRNLPYIRSHRFCYRGIVFWGLCYKHGLI